MAKTESTAVTRLIELSQQRSVEGDLDWFAPQPPKRFPREEVTQVVRIARRALRVSPMTVLGAFLAGMLTVIVTTLVLRESAPVVHVAAPTATVVAPIAAPAAPAAPVVTPIRPEPPTVTVTAAVPETETETAAETETVTETVAVTETETVAVRVRPDRSPKLRRPPRTTAAALKPSPSRRPSPKPATDTGALAELRINSKPPCELYIDGRKIGWTPQRGVSVAPGRHTIVFRNREQGVERKVIVDAKVGQVHRLIRDFTEP